MTSTEAEPTFHEYEVNLVDEGGLSEEKNHWVRVQGNEDVVVAPVD